MGYWVHRFARSRRVRVAALAGVGLLTTGTCGGALLANYTVAGIDPAYVAKPVAADPQPKRGAADWLADEAFKSVERDRAKADFADPWKPEPAD